VFLMEQGSFIQVANTQRTLLDSLNIQIAVCWDVITQTGTQVPTFKRNQLLAASFFRVT
jgi:hypothetical protein